MIARLAIAMLIALSGGARAAEPALTAVQDKGRTLFNESCSFCHSERGHATTLLAKCASRYENAPDKYQDTPGYRASKGPAA